MHYTLQGVPQFRIKLHCGTPFLMVRNLSDYRLNSGFVFADIWKRFDWHCPILLWRFLLRLRSYSLRLKNFPAFAGESCQATPAGRCFPGWTPPHTGKKNVYRQTGGFPTMKFVCPKMKWEYDKLTKKSKRVCHCEDPCTESSCGRMFLSLSRKNCVLIQEHCVVHRNGMPIQNPCECRKINQPFQGQLLCCRTQNPEWKDFARWFAACQDCTACHRNGCRQDP